MSFLQAVIDEIVAADTATFGQDLFANTYPARAPDTCLLAIDNGGPEPSVYAPLREMSLQVLSRAPDYRDAKARVEQVFGLFHGRHNYVLGEFYILVSRAVQEPAYIGPDDKGRAELSVNFLFRVRGN